MATLRPQLVRADTLDLQDHDSPSAQDHSHQPYHGEPLGTGPPAPHQEYTLRHLEEERSAEQDHLADAWGSGRSSHEGSDLLNDEDVDEERTSSDELRSEDARMRQNEGEASESGENDADDGVDEDLDDRVSSSPSIPDDEAAEQDEGFVWALHNFVATVEGQANATKGDVMVLLDDSNSYWWLVRVVKDSSIGYLPAEHIETHQERLARYNKHRNLEFAQTMLGDTQERSKNPLKKAMRRRNAKQVQFSTPTFYDPPNEQDWSDADTDMEHEEEEATTVDASTDPHAAEQNGIGDEIESIGPRVIAQTNEEPVLANDMEISVDQNGETAHTTLESSSLDKESPDGQETSNRSRNGTLRNTDSFFNDDTAEPRKISLTPNLLRDETAGSERTVISQDSVEQADKPNLSVDKLREDRKKKEKKPGMLSGLFKRKDKKIKVDEAAGGVVVKHEDESGSPVLTPGDGGSPSGKMSPTIPQSSQPAKKSPTPAKLSKSPPISVLKNGNGASRSFTEPAQPSENATAEQSAFTDTINDEEDMDAEPEPTSAEFAEQTIGPSQNGQVVSKESPALTFATQKAASAFSRDDAEQNTARAIGTSQERTSANTVHTSDKVRDPENLYLSSPDSSDLAAGVVTAETPAILNSSSRFPIPGSSAITEKRQSDLAIGSRTAPITDMPNRSLQTGAESLSTQTTSSASSAMASSPVRDYPDESWNGVALKAYLDGQSNDDAKNMLIIIHNQTDVTPLPLDHPTMLALGYHEQQKRLNEMSSQLDSMLQGFLARRAARPKPTTR